MSVSAHTAGPAAFAPADLSDPETFVAGVPHETFRWLRENAPVYWQGETGRSGSLPGPGYWALTRYEDIAYVSKNAQLFSSGVGTCVISDLPQRDLENMQQQLINMDPPQHTELRGLMNPHFKPCLLYTSPSPRDQRGSRMPSSA